MGEHRVFGRLHAEKINAPQRAFPAPCAHQRARFRPGFFASGRRAARQSAVGVFPIPRLARGEPRQRGGESFATRLRARRFSDPLAVLRGGGPEEIFQTSRWRLDGSSTRRRGRRARAAALALRAPAARVHPTRRIGWANGAAFARSASMRGSDCVGMRGHLVSAKLNVSQILLRTRSGAGSHSRGCP